MKKLKFLTLILSFLFISQLAVAAPVNNQPVTQPETLSFKFDLGDLTNADLEEIATTIDNLFEAFIPTSPETAELQCSVTVEGSVSIKGVGEFRVSVTVSGSCSEVARSGKQVAQMVLQDVKDEIAQLF